MNKFAIIVLASTAMAVPAFAAPMNNTPPKQPQQQSQKQPSAQQNSKQNQQQARNAPQQNKQATFVRLNQLSHNQVRRIQMTLNKDGFDAGPVDGMWGRKTTDAVKNFQQAKNIQGNGRLTQKTLSDLGLQVASNQKNTATNMGNRAQNPNPAPNNDQGQTGR